MVYMLLIKREAQMLLRKIVFCVGSNILFPAEANLNMLAICMD